MKNYSIAIDGPAGSGKSSVAKEVAKQLNFKYVNSGAFYRAIAFYFYRKKIDYNNQFQINEEWLKQWIKIDWDGESIFLNDEDVSDRINENYVSNIASIIGTFPIIRQYVNNLILNLSKKNSVVVDGRDIGSVVLPNATVKIFLDADVKTRAIRRLKQLKQKGGYRKSNIDDIVTDLIERDNRDYSRSIAPLVKTNDAVVIDNSNMSFDETIAAIKKAYIGKVIDEDWKM